MFNLRKQLPDKKIQLENLYKNIKCFENRRNEINKETSFITKKEADELNDIAILLSGNVLSASYLDDEICEIQRHILNFRTCPYP